MRILMSCGNSLSLVLRRKRPKRVTRGSSAGERLAPIGTGVSYIVRNLYILNSLPSLPTLSQRKNTGPFESILIKRAINGKRGIVIDIPINDRKISVDLLSIVYFYQQFPERNKIQ